MIRGLKERTASPLALNSHGTRLPGYRFESTVQQSSASP